MATFVYTVAEESGYDPCLVANSIQKSEDIRITNMQQIRGGFDVIHTSEDGLEVKLIPRILPEIEITQYILNQRLWSKALADGDLYYAVGGINQCCFPLTAGEYVFGSWIATTLWEDRVPRLKTASLAHQIRDRLSKPFLEYIESTVFEATDDLLVLSNHTKERITEKYDIVEESMSVVPHPIDTTRFSPGREAEETPPTILFVGRINDSRKNVDLLLDSFETVVSRHPNSNLQLVGATPNAHLEQIVSEKGLTDKVEFVDFVPNDELPKYYVEADVFCIPSNQEGLAIVGLEAMACGTPVVSTRCGGPEDYVRDGHTGYLVPKNNERKLADRLCDLLSNVEKKETFGQNARSLILSEYDRTDIRDRFLSSLEQIQEMQS